MLIHNISIISISPTPIVAFHGSKTQTKAIPIAILPTRDPEQIPMPCPVGGAAARAPPFHPDASHVYMPQYYLYTQRPEI